MVGQAALRGADSALAATPLRLSTTTGEAEQTPRAATERPSMRSQALFFLSSSHSSDSLYALSFAAAY
jgi:hypothetical protein